MGICHQAIFTKTLLAHQIGFNEQYKICADYNMMMEIYKNNGKFLHIKIQICIYDVNGISKQKWRLCYEEESKICNTYGSFLYFLILYKRLLFRMIRKILRQC